MTTARAPRAREAPKRVPAQPADAPTQPQLDLVAALLEERQVPPGYTPDTSAAGISGTIDALKAMPRLMPMRRDDAAPGFYRHGGESYYVAESAENPGHTYARRVVRWRVHLAGGAKVTHYDFEYAPGMGWRLRPDERVPLTDSETAALREAMRGGLGDQDADLLAQTIGPIGTVSAATERGGHDHDRNARRYPPRRQR